MWVYPTTGGTFPLTDETIALEGTTMTIHIEKSPRIHPQEPWAYLIRWPGEWQLCLPSWAVRVTW
ncbi:hypothetical protein [Primorskyibacter sp. 2E233]|uniref:hypothetical protein n=1 Tax=Primorskyibacter sp. 2E233 TaxID=3413431 RepID=UPI003BF32528